MKIIKAILPVIFSLLLIYLLISTWQNPHQAYYGSRDSYIYSKGDASEEVRGEILGQLRTFQEGYTKRDTSLVEAFMQELFSRENVTILGTMPNEIYTGYERASELVRTDWQSWGDCTFLVENANISAFGETACFSTIGYVKFDIFKRLVMPLRLSGVLVKEDFAWKFRQMQFQFDLSLTFVLLILIILLLWMLFSVVRLVVVVIKSLRTAKD